MEALTQIRKLAGSLIIGTDVTMKYLRAGKVKTVFLSSNCPKGVEEDIRHYAGEKVKVEKLEVPNDELGVICKKGFPISVVSVK